MKRCHSSSEPERSGENSLPDYCRKVTIRAANGTLKELIYPKALDLFRPKRSRTTFTNSQLMELEKAFQCNQYLIGRERTDLARRLDLSEMQVKIWFQNRRTKRKRESQPSPGPEPVLPLSDEEEVERAQQMFEASSPDWTTSQHPHHHHQTQALSDKGAQPKFPPENFNHADSLTEQLPCYGTQTNGDRHNWPQPTTPPMLAFQTQFLNRFFLNLR